MGIVRINPLTNTVVCLGGPGVATLAMLATWHPLCSQVIPGRSRDLRTCTTVGCPGSRPSVDCEQNHGTVCGRAGRTSQPSCGVQWFHFIQWDYSSPWVNGIASRRTISSVKPLLPQHNHFPALRSSPPAHFPTHSYLRRPSR